MKRFLPNILPVQKQVYTVLHSLKGSKKIYCCLTTIRTGSMNSKMVKQWWEQSSLKMLFMTKKALRLCTGSLPKRVKQEKKKARRIGANTPWEGGLRSPEK